MKIVADRFIPFLEGVFEPYAEVIYKDGPDICREDCLDADVLITRTRTKCNADLLEGTNVKMISTATIGTDHIDLPWCEEHGIEVYNAAGCNAGGVMDYVFSALYGVAARKKIPLQDAKLGIVGVGHVGRKIERAGRKLGFQILRCDPPRAEKEGPEGFCSLDELLAEAQIVTLHVPLDETTRAMANDEFFAKIQPGAIFINAARGEIVDESALLRARPKLGALVIDTWCNEPDVNPHLIAECDIATPHIAGYSYQGKQNGTAMAVRAVARRYGIPQLEEFYPETENLDLHPVIIDVAGKSQGEIASMVQYNYPIFTDDFMFRTDPQGFERLRSMYQYRREYYID
ncbi:MAG: 4-phosphoerythronate dehydrogenase [Bacteroidales bacterium]|nr:4-phosphoerythronate dehydrogenase [Fibrobacter sp.]MBR3387785.1 4-phosphoerythronate dehydrogenase [Bacteroidales bacterium]